MSLPVLFLFAAIVVTGTANASNGTNQYFVRSSDPDVSRAGQLLNSSQPSQAFELLQGALQRHPQDPKVLLLAGLAAYRSDEIQAAHPVLEACRSTWNPTKR